MNRIIVDDALKVKLQHLTAPALLTDAQGNTIGTVLPEHLGPISMECPHPPEEIARRLANPGRLYTGEEIDAMLEKR